MFKRTYKYFVVARVTLSNGKKKYTSFEAKLERKMNLEAIRTIESELAGLMGYEYALVIFYSKL